MSEVNFLKALLAKRAEIAGQLQTAQAEHRRLMIDLDAIDAAIRIFNPEIEFDQLRPKLPPRLAAHRGEVARIVLGTLRTTHHPMTTDELTTHVMVERDLNSADKVLLRIIRQRVDACVRHYRAKGLVQSAPGPGKRMLWRLA